MTPESHDVFKQAWYSEKLAAMGESRLLEGPGESYRFLWLPSFDNPMVVRISCGENAWEMMAQRLDGRGGFEPGAIVERTARQLSEQETANLRTLISAAEFWGEQPRDECPGMRLDGDHWILEGKRAQSYHVWDVWSPHASGPYASFRKLCVELLRLSGLTIAPVESPPWWMSNPGMLEIRSVIDSIAGTDACVLIRGESSRLRDLVGRTIHAASARHGGPFVSVSAALPAEWLEAELFGYEGRTSTGAPARKWGLFEIAAGATLYFEEIAGLSLDLQVKLHRVLQDRQFSRVGGQMLINVGFRVIAATSRDLEGAVARGEFMGELYNLLKVAEIAAPPLTREERDLAKAEEEEDFRCDQARFEAIDVHNEACRAFARTGSDEGLISDIAGAGHEKTSSSSTTPTRVGSRSSCAGPADARLVTSSSMLDQRGQLLGTALVC